ncbi:hypothetical protein [Bdellovibrio sp. HCB-162]|uniref:hypothetical protein n=1 Tax=Bdellovibrio sp. HCB-162 TaxID=3394234 RepID=UPI0039BD4A33
MKLLQLTGIVTLTLSFVFIAPTFAKGPGGVMPCTGKGLPRCVNRGHRVTLPENNSAETVLTGIYRSDCKMINGNFASSIVRINASATSFVIDIPSEMNLKSPALTTIESYPIGISRLHNLGEGFREYKAGYNNGNFVLTVSQARFNADPVELTGTQTIERTGFGVLVVETDAQGTIVNQCTMIPY